MTDKGDNSYLILIDEMLQIVFYYKSYKTIMSIIRAQI